MAKNRMTIYEFAKACGVSIGTVSRAINGRKNVNAETRAHILERMQALGYQPSSMARALSMGCSKVISLWIGYLKSAYAAKVLGEFEQHLAESDYEMMVRDLWNRSPDDSTRPISPSVVADGVIVVDSVQWVQRLIEGRSESSIPIVNTGVYWSDSVDHVGIDLVDGVREAIQHLASVGCRRIAYLAPGDMATPNDSRFRTYQQTMKELGLPLEPIKSQVSTRRDAEKAIEQYLDRKKPPDGLFCFNDDHALAAYRAFRRRGLKVPEDVAIVGCDGIEETEYLECPLSTVIQPYEEVCAMTWHFLEQRMKNPEQAIQSVVFRPRLEIRASSRR